MIASSSILPWLSLYNSSTGRCSQHPTCLHTVRKQCLSTLPNAERVLVFASQEEAIQVEGQVSPARR